MNKFMVGLDEGIRDKRAVLRVVNEACGRAERMLELDTHYVLDDSTGDITVFIEAVDFKVYNGALQSVIKGEWNIVNDIYTGILRFRETKSVKGKRGFLYWVMGAKTELEAKNPGLVLDALDSIVLRYDGKQKSEVVGVYYCNGSRLVYHKFCFTIINGVGVSALFVRGSGLTGYRVNLPDGAVYDVDVDLARRIGLYMPSSSTPIIPLKPAGNNLMASRVEINTGNFVSYIGDRPNEVNRLERILKTGRED